MERTFPPYPIQGLASSDCIWPALISLPTNASCVLMATMSPVWTSNALRVPAGAALHLPVCVQSRRCSLLRSVLASANACKRRGRVVSHLSCLHLNGVGSALSMVAFGKEAAASQSQACPSPPSSSVEHMACRLQLIFQNFGKASILGSIGHPGTSEVSS